MHVYAQPSSLRPTNETTLFLGVFQITKYGQFTPSLSLKAQGSGIVQPVLYK